MASVGITAQYPFISLDFEQHRGGQSCSSPDRLTRTGHRVRPGAAARDADHAAAATPMGRMGEPGDIAQLALFLASPAAAWVTGQVVDAAGGWGLCG